MECKWKAGDKVPAFEAKDETGELISDKTLLGQPAVIYFYPKDDTPGCTTEACAFRDFFHIFNERGIHLIGVSPDPVKSHLKFKEKYLLPFPLIADPDKKICEAFDVLKEKNLYGKTSIGVVRSTFVISPTGEFFWIEQPVKVEGHIDRVFQALDQMKSVRPS